MAARSPRVRFGQPEAAACVTELVALNAICACGHVPLPLRCAAVTDDCLLLHDGWLFHVVDEEMPPVCHRSTSLAVHEFASPR